MLTCKTSCCVQILVVVLNCYFLLLEKKRKKISIPDALSCPFMIYYHMFENRCLTCFQ